MQSISTAILLVVYVGMVAAQRRPIVRSASYNVETKAIDIDIEYGGCVEHTFKLETGACFETFPAQCNTVLIDTTNKEDQCEKLIIERISIDLQETKLADEYHSGATITIRGDQNSKAVVILPEYHPL
jgi:hypothetical protein